MKWSDLVLSFTSRKQRINKLLIGTSTTVPTVYLTLAWTVVILQWSTSFILYFNISLVALEVVLVMCPKIWFVNTNNNALKKRKCPTKSKGTQLFPSESEAQICPQKTPGAHPLFIHSCHLVSLIIALVIESWLVKPIRTCYLYGPTYFWLGYSQYSPLLSVALWTSLL